MGLTTPTVKRAFWASLGVACIAVIISIGAGVQTANQHRQREFAENNGQVTVATVTTVTSQSRGGLTQEAIVKLTDGRQATVDVSDDARYEDLKAGDRISVRIDPRDNSRAFPSTASDGSTLQAIMSVVGPIALIAIASLVVAAVLRRQWTAANRAKVKE